MATETDLQSTFKSNDTEETIDVYFTRPIGLAWAKFFNLFGTHPNVITILSIILGAAAGGFMAFGEGSWTNTLVGIALLMWANFYDSADGQLARMTGKKTLWGRILDGFAGDVWFVGIYAAIGFRLMAQPILPFWDGSPMWSWWIFPLLYYIGFHAHAVQSRLADYYRNVHLYFIKGVAGSELDSAEKLRAEYAALRWNDRFAWKLFLHFYCNYTAGQERDTPQFQAFKCALDAKYGRHLPADLVAEFRRGSLPLMKWTNVLTFNWRAITLYISLLVGVLVPWFVVVYPLMELTLFHLIYRHMRCSHEALSARLAATL
ncbi:MAG: CDP-alcohol phosphatidyltransferase family protein [Alloprevotella sp.]|nr:MAG: CDP-alcohol phosphatidyltransferase family protein [Alloprevotella sp.]